VYRRLEFAPASPFHDIEGTVKRLRDAYPGISDLGVNQAVKKMLVGYKPRHKGRIVHLFGADIMTADLANNPAWKWIGPGERIRLLDHPINGGVVIPNDIEGPVRLMLQEELWRRLNRREVNRSVLISPPGLRQTYVWRAENGWLQEVNEHDYDLILSTPANRRLFRDPDIHGPYVPVRSYDAPGQMIGVAHTNREAEYLIRQTRRRPSWQGADVSE
jgi:hypothetical protein